MVRNNFKNLTIARKISFFGILSATAIIFSLLESLIPAFPFMPPGCKPGFSNIVTMFAASFSGLSCALAVAVIKSLFVLLTRGFSAFLMSLAGGLISTIVMWAFFRMKFGYTGIGIAGAAAHNTAQLAVSILLTGTPALIYYYPALLVFAVITGTITGLILKIILPAVLKLRIIQ